MKKSEMRHPEEEELLRYADGEVPSRTALEIRSHLEACWECRADLEELQKTIGECVRYRKSVLESHLPPPPAPWTDIYRGFDKIDAELDEGGLRSRLGRALREPLSGVKKWAPAAAAVALACLLVYRFRQTPSVQAAELLRKAIAAADARPAKGRHLEIRTKDRVIRAALTAADRDALNSLQARLRTARYDWDDPLNPKAYEAWRNQLADKRDEVIEEQDVYRIRTVSESGELAQADLRIRARDWQPVGERFEFRNREWVEIAEIPEETVSPENIAGAARPEPRIQAPHGSLPEQAPRTSPAAFATIGDEVRVLAALRQVGADLGDPIEVSRTGAEVLVTGVGISPERQQEISAALRSQPHVVVRFPEVVIAESKPEEGVPADGKGSIDLEQAQDRLARRFGGRASFAQLATQVLDLSEPMMSRAYALRRLAEQIPVEGESELSAPDRRLLGTLRREHSTALREQAAEIDRVLRQALAPAGGVPRVTAQAALSGPWQPATEKVFQSARQVEKLMAVLFGAAAGEAPGGDLPAQLLSSVGELRARLEAYDRLSSEETERRTK